MSNAVGKRWTDDEIKLLYSDLPNDEVARRLGRTVDGVYTKRYLLGIDIRKYGSSRKELNSNDAKYVIIDGEKLRKEFRMRGLTHEAVADKLGVGSSTIGNMVVKCRMQRPYMVAMTTLLGIEYDDIKPDEKKEEVRVETTPVLTDEQFETLISTIKESNKVNWDAMYKTIYAAVYEAVKRALNEPIDETNEGDN